MSWKYIYSSVRGTSHEANNTLKQDSCKIIQMFIHGKNYLVSAVADGAGSAKHSDISSNFICKLFLKKTQQWLNTNNLGELTKEVIEGWFIYFQKVMKRTVSIYKLTSIKDLATTLLFSVLSEDFNIFVQIGDGIIAINSEQELECVFLPQNGEFINTTHFATEDRVLELFMFKTSTEKVKQLVMHTDGIEQIAFNFAQQKTFTPFFVPFFNALNNNSSFGYLETLSNKLGEFLQSDRVNKKTDDDKTLFIASLCGVSTEEKLLEPNCE